MVTTTRVSLLHGSIVHEDRIGNGAKVMNEKVIHILVVTMSQGR